MNFFDQPCSTQWSALEYGGEKIAEVWFKPQGDPFVLVFRVPQWIFQIPGMGPQLTTENLLKAVTIAPEMFESWSQGDVSHWGMNGTNPELGNPLPPPRNVTYLEIYVRLKPPETAARQANNELEIPSKTWQELEVLWKGILALETTMDGLHKFMEGILAEMEASLTKTLMLEEKLHALRTDVAQWEKAKSRVRYQLPKMREYIHRSTWAMGSTERKRLEELYRDHIEPHIPFFHMNEALRELEGLQKDRQVLAGHGQSVIQESRAILAEVQGALKTLQSNAAAISKKKKGATGGKFFKDLRRMTGAE